MYRHGAALLIDVVPSIISKEDERREARWPAICSKHRASLYRWGYRAPTYPLPPAMKTFHCDHCQHLVFFENVQCVQCEHPLAYLPDIADMGSLEPAGEDIWRTPQP